MGNQLSQPKVVCDKNGYYVARTTYLELKGIEVPFMRLSDYYGNRHMATKRLNELLEKGVLA